MIQDFGPVLPSDQSLNISKKEQKTILSRWEKITNLSAERLQINATNNGQIELKINLSSLGRTSNNLDQEISLMLRDITKFVKSVRNKNIDVVVSELNLSGNKISENVFFGAPADLSTEEAKKYVKNKLRGFKYITSLNLNDTECTTNLLKFIRKELPDIESIYLNNCKKLIELHENLRLPKKIKVISVENTPITRLPDRLKNKFPNLELKTKDFSRYPSRKPGVMSSQVQPNSKFPQRKLPENARKALYFTPPQNFEELSAKYGIDRDLFLSMLKAFDDSKGELAEVLARCIKNGNIKDVSAFNNRADDLAIMLGVPPDMKHALEVLSFTSIQPDIYVNVYVKIFNLCNNDPSTRKFLPYLSESFLLDKIDYLINNKELDKNKLFFCANYNITRENILIEASHLSESEMQVIDEYKNKFMHANDYLSSCFALKKLNIPLPLLKNFSTIELSNADRICGPSRERLRRTLTYSHDREIGVREYIDLLQNAKNVPHYFYLLSTSADEDEKNALLDTSSFPTPEGIWEHYIVRKEGFAKSIYGMDQQQYGMRLHEATLIAAAALKEKRWNFHQHLNFLASKRREVAESLPSKDTSHNYGYGVLRNWPMKTVCNGPYQNLGDSLDISHKKWSKNKDLYAEALVEGEKGGIIYGNIHGKKVALSLLHFKEGNNTIHHTSEENIPAVLEHVSELYDHALSIDDQEMLLQELGKIFWWICQAKPWVFGDPSIAEMLIKSIWLQKTGENLPPWRTGLIPWESSMEYIDPEEYGRNFASHFSKNPIT